MKFMRSIMRKISCTIMVIILISAGYNIVLRFIYPKKYSDKIDFYCNEYGIDKNLVYAIIKAESNYKPNAVSDADARGLMQITEETFYDVSKMLDEPDKYNYINDSIDPAINIKFGTKYLSFLMELFNGDKVAALAAYNAGMGNVYKWMDKNGSLAVSDIEFPETAEYVKKVLAAEKKYKKLYN